MQTLESTARPNVIVKKSPVTGEKLGEFPIVDRAGVEAAVARARSAFASWKLTTVEERLSMLSRMNEVLRAHRDEYAQRISEDTGKPLVDSVMT
jgi:acyl-CoA reductase-like NAD-dependent aldehyde dehydrogenase